MTALAAVLVAWAAIAPATGEVVIEPKTGIGLPAKVGDMSLLGIGLRTKTFLRFKVYALGLYVADTALSGALVAHKQDLDSSAFYRHLVVGDFEKQFVLALVRDLSAAQIQGSFREHMPTADRELLAQFVAYFGATKAGQRCVLHWVPGHGLETTVGGVVKPVITSKAFADDVFAIWLRDRPSEDPIRRQVVSRARQLLD